MDKEIFDYVKARAEILSSTPAAKQITQEAARAWLDAVEVDSSDEAIENATSQLLDYLDGRPNSIDGVIAFAQGPAIEMMGKEGAEAFLAMQLERKAQGARYCDCPACTAASEVLAKFGRIEL